MISKVLEILIIQPSLQLNNLNANLSEYQDLIVASQKFRSNQSVICLPEYWNGLRREVTSEHTFSKSLQFLERISSEYSSWVIGGSQVVLEDQDIFNRSHIFDPSGNMIGCYNKRHPFGYERVQGFTQGTKELIWEISGWRAAIRICSDLWNTQDFLKLIETEIDILFCPTLTAVPSLEYTNYGRLLWHNLALVRAKEAAMVLVVSDMAEQIIREPHSSAGASCLVDPSWRFVNSDELGKNLLTAIEKGKRGSISKAVDYERLQSQKTYRKNIGLMEN